MQKESIITLPDKRLRQRSQKVGFIGDAIKKLADDMSSATLNWEDSRKHEFGVALAAVQIGELWRVIIIRNDFENKEDRSFQILINPEITKTDGVPEYDTEGCLSIRDVYAKVPRYPKVKVKALDLDGKEVRVTAEGFVARVLQHEIDHTNGELFIDHVDDDTYYRIDNDSGELIPLGKDEYGEAGLLRD